MIKKELSDQLLKDIYGGVVKEPSIDFLNNLIDVFSIYNTDSLEKLLEAFELDWQTFKSLLKLN